MSELRETIARIIDPEAWEPWEGYPIGQRAALEKADLVLALPQLAETSAAVGVLLEYDGEFDTGYRFIKTGDTPRPEWLRGVTTTPLFALPQLASVGRDSSSQSQPGADAGPEARADTEAEPSAVWRPTHVHADGGEYRLIRHADGRSDQHEPWLAGVIYEGADGRLWWTGNDRWFDRFTALPLPNIPLSAGKEGC